MYLLSCHRAGGTLNTDLMTIVSSRFINIANDHARAQLYPERGFQLFGFQVRRRGEWRELVHAPAAAVEPADRRYGNPVLFPAVGVSNGVEADSWNHEGKSLAMPPHGWARNVYWQVEEVTETSMTAIVVPHPGFKLGFPFDFRLRMTYRLEGATLALETELANEGNLAFPYALGFHPYLRAPLVGDDRSTCRVQLPGGQRLRTQDGWRSFKVELESARSIALDDAELPGSIILLETGALSMDLRDEGAGLASRVSVEGSGQDFPVWVVWNASPEAPYVCLEPWTDAPNALNRTGTRRLPAQQTHRYRMSLSLHEL